MRLSQRQHRITSPLAWVAWLLLVWAHIVHPVHSAHLLTALDHADTPLTEQVAAQPAEPEPHPSTRSPHDCPHHAEHQHHSPEQTAGEHHHQGHAAAHDHDPAAHYCPHCTVAGLFWLPDPEAPQPPILQQGMGKKPLPATPVLRSSSSLPQQPRAPPV